MRSTPGSRNSSREPRGPQVGAFIAQYGIFIALAVLIVVFSITVERNIFLSQTNLENILRQNSFTAILAIGMTLAILTAGIDLSVGSVVALSGVICVDALVHGFSIPVATALGMLTGGLVGLVNGLLITRLRVPPFLASLAMMLIVRNLAHKYNKAETIRVPPELSQSFPTLSNGWAPAIVVVLVIVVSWFLLARTAFGRYVYAIGGNRQAAHLAGIRVSRVLVQVYILCGLAAGLAGVIVASRLNSGYSRAGEGFELDAVAATVVGGTSLFGGRGSVWGTLAGVFFIGVLNNGLNLHGVADYDQRIIKGLVLIAATSLDLWRGGNREEGI